MLWFNKWQEFYIKKWPVRYWIFKHRYFFSPLMLCIHALTLTITLQANG